MSKTDPPRAPQTIYPEAKERFGLDAKQPIRYSIPIPTLSIFLALPVYSVTAYFFITNYIATISATTLAVERIAVIVGMMILGIISILMLIKARSIIVRNCSHPFIVQLLYVVVVIPVSVAAYSVLSSIYGESELTVLLVYQAVVTYAISLLLTFLAWSMSQS